MELVTRPFCPQCGRIRPEGRTESDCVPCFNTGHSYRLVQDEADRLARIARWDKYHKEQRFTKAEVDAIPTVQNLRRYTFDPAKV